MEQLIYRHYGWMPENCTRMNAGVGGAVYLVESVGEKYILKLCRMDDYVVNEPDVAAHLRREGIPAPEYLPTLSSEYFWKHEGNACLLRRFVAGEVFEYNCAPAWFLPESARLLGRLHASLSGFRRLSVGMGQGFLDYMASGKPAESYRRTLEQARERADAEAEQSITYRLSQANRLQALRFDLARFTCANTHGDYKITNIVCADGHITSLIDLSGACVLPAVWEVIRSYTYADPACHAGQIGMDTLLSYVREYLRHFPLNEYDLGMMPYFYWHQLLACDYYGQYYDAEGPNRDDFLRQAQLATGLIRWFELHAEELATELVKLA